MSDPTVTVYALLFHEARAAYVGCTKNLDARLASHRGGKTAVANLVNAGETPIVEVLHKGTPEAMDGKERAAFDAMEADGWTMLNERVPAERVMHSSRTDDDTVHLGIRVPREMIDQLDRYAKREGVSRSDAARFILKRALGRIRVTGTAS